MKFLVVVAFAFISASTALQSECPLSTCQGNSVKFNSDLFAFGLNLHRKAVDVSPNENTFFSPTSISTAFAMLFEGTANETAAELKRLLFPGVACPRKIFHDFFDEINQANRPFQLELANGLFVEQSYELNHLFEEILQQCYSAEAKSVDFLNNSDNQRRLINQWVEQKTRNKIMDLLSADSVNALTRLVLVNAIYFKADWKTQFKRSNTQKQPFYRLDGTQTEVDMMRINGENNHKISFNYWDDEQLDAEILELPYKNDEVSMIIFLPKKNNGLPELESKLTAEKLNNLETYKTALAEVALPKFKVEHELDLKQLMENLGVSKIFDSTRADLSKISANGERNLFVSGAYHKAFIEVNEQGTEAAAATAIVAHRRAYVDVEPKIIIVDHPFFYVIRHNPSQVPLFIGRLLDVPGTTGPIAVSSDDINL